MLLLAVLIPAASVVADNATIEKAAKILDKRRVDPATAESDPIGNVEKGREVRVRGPAHAGLLLLRCG